MSKCFNQVRTLGCAALALVISTAAAHAQSSGCFSVSAERGMGKQIIHAGIRIVHCDIQRHTERGRSTDGYGHGFV